MKRVVVSHSALSSILKEIEKEQDAETGGVLLGRYTNDEILVETATSPGPNAIHEIIYFEPDHDYTQMLIDMAAANSKGRIVYLGEWHSHPEVYPHPSHRDIDALVSTAFDPDCNTPEPLLMIIGAVSLTAKNIEKHTAALIANSRTEKLTVVPVQYQKER